MPDALHDDHYAAPLAERSLQRRVLNLTRQLTAAEAENGGLSREITALRERLRLAEDVCREIDWIVDDSRGVAGFHLNGSVAGWSEFGALMSARAAWLPAAEHIEEANADGPYCVPSCSCGWVGPVRHDDPLDAHLMWEQHVREMS